MKKMKIELVDGETGDLDDQRFMVFDADNKSSVYKQQVNRKGQRGNNSSPTPEDVVSTGSSSYEEEKASHVVEYEWPMNSGAFHFIEQYLAEFLLIKSLRRSYPDLVRRKIICIEEREFLLDNKLISELQADLGVIAISAEDVYKSIAPKFPKKFQVYKDIFACKKYEKTVEEIWNKALAEPPIVFHLRNASTGDCAKWNNRCKFTTKYKSRRYVDSQTRLVHKRTTENVKTENLYHQYHHQPPTVGCFPVALIPGQYVDNPLSYSSDDLQRLPLNTVLNVQLENDLVTSVSPIASSKVFRPYYEENKCKNSKSFSCSTNRAQSCDEGLSSSSESFFENIFRSVLSKSTQKPH